MRRGSSFFTPEVNGEFNKLSEQFSELVANGLTLDSLQEFIKSLANFFRHQSAMIKSNLKIGPLLASLLHECDQLKAEHLSRKIMHLRCYVAADEDFSLIADAYLKQYDKLFYFQIPAPFKKTEILSSRELAIKEIIEELRDNALPLMISESFFEKLLRFVEIQSHQDPCLQQYGQAREVCVFILTSENSSRDMKNSAWHLYQGLLYPGENSDREIVLEQLQKLLKYQKDSRYLDLENKIKLELPWYSGFLMTCGF